MCRLHKIKCSITQTQYIMLVKLNRSVPFGKLENLWQIIVKKEISTEASVVNLSHGLAMACHQIRIEYNRHYFRSNSIIFINVINVNVKKRKRENIGIPNSNF